jgi:hypothetical protein
MGDLYPDKDAGHLSRTPLTWLSHLGTATKSVKPRLYSDSEHEDAKTVWATSI